MTYKTFNGKRYTLQDTSTNKKRLLKIAARLRRTSSSKGRQNARVVKVGKNKFSLYTRQIKQKR